MANGTKTTQDLIFINAQKVRSDTQFVSHRKSDAIHCSTAQLQLPRTPKHGQSMYRLIAVTQQKVAA